MKRKGPKLVAMVAGLLWGGGVFPLAVFAHRLWWLYLTYGVIGGIGLGMGYIVPITVLVKWFPDRRGLITGIAVAVVRRGALFAAPAAGWLIQHVGLMPTFAYLGAAYAVVGDTASGAFMQNPPEDWGQQGWAPIRITQISRRCATAIYTLAEALRTTWQWWAICFLMSVNTMSGLSIVSRRHRPFFRRWGKQRWLPRPSWTMVGIMALGNGAGRIFWSWVSDLTTRKAAFFMMYLVEVALFWTYHGIHSLALLDRCHFHPRHVLRRRIRDYARLRRRLFRAPRCRLHFWFDDAAMGVRRRLWTAAFRLSTADQRKLCSTRPSTSIGGLDDRRAHPSRGDPFTAKAGPAR